MVRKMPNVSVVIPTFNRPQLLARAIASVLGQTYRDFEIIVVQNGPGEYSKPVVEQFAKQGVPVRYFHEAKPDPVNARNVGVKQSQTEFVAFLDDDDEWLSEKLEQQIALMENSDNVGLVFSCPRIVMKDGNVVPEKLRAGGSASYKRFIAKGNFIRSLSGVLIRRKCFDKAGYFDIRYSICNDYDFYLRIAKNYEIRMTKDPLYCYHLHDGNLTNNVLLGYREMVGILKSVESNPELGVTKGLLKRTIRKYSRSCCGAAVDAMETKNYSLAFKCYFSGLSHEPFAGLKMRWGRFRNPFYHFLRPYLAMIYCGFKSLEVTRMIFGSENT